MIKKINLIIVLGMLISTNLFGQQDPHFSQFFASPLTLNPANAGIFNGDLRAVMNYRSQWGGVSKAYSTSAASLDMPILKKLSGGMFGLGLNFFKDAAGDSKLSTTNFALSLAYHLDISGGSNNHFISLGFQGGVIQRSISYDNLTWDNQWNGYGFDRQTEVLNIDDLGGTSAGGLDLSTGLHWYYAPSEGTRFHGGLSMFHANRADVGFNAESKLMIKYTLHGGGEIGMGNGEMAITPNFVTVHQGANKYTDIGAEFKYFLKENSKFTNYSNVMYISFGPYLRWGDATYIVARYSWAGMIASVSYDFNISDLSNASGGTGGFEVMLGYKMDLGSSATRGHSVKFQ
jgi:type IX secretion system PorP/SprF family membrane protein